MLKIRLNNTQHIKIFVYIREDKKISFQIHGFFFSKTSFQAQNSVFLAQNSCFLEIKTQKPNFPNQKIHI